MSEVRLNFLNWRPDADEFGNDGLTVAKNVVHDTDGYKPIYVATAYAAATSTAVSSTVPSLQVRPIGSGTQTLRAWISGDQINVGIDGVTATSAVTGYPISFATASSYRNITFFDVCEAPGYIFFTLGAEQVTVSPSTTVATLFNGLIAL